MFCQKSIAKVVLSFYLETVSISPFSWWCPLFASMTGAVWGINVIIQPSTSIASRITIDKPGLGGPDKMVVMVMMAKMVMMVTA